MNTNMILFLMIDIGPMRSGVSLGIDGEPETEKDQMPP